MSNNADNFELLNDIDLFVIDFSTIANLNSTDVFDELVNFWVNHRKSVAVTRDFYENYDVIIQCRNEEQKRIANYVVSTLETLKGSNLLKYFSNQTRPGDLIEKLHKNPRVCFVYYKYSEFAENVCDYEQNLMAKAIVLNASGELIVCTDKDAIWTESFNRIDKSVIGDGFFKNSYIPTTGDYVKTRDGERYHLTSTLGAGGEGTVYDCQKEGIGDGTDYVVKIYHKGQLNKLRLKKLMIMETKKVDFNGVSWPEKLIYSEKGEPVGYIMKKIKGKPLSAIFSSDEDVLKEFPYWTRENVLWVIIEVLKKIQYLHLFGIIVGDLRLRNIIIDQQGNVSLCDIDSCQINDLPCPAGFPDFTAPEIYNIEFGKKLRTYRNENFACSVVLFKLLFCGLHPYDQIDGADSIQMDINRKKFPYPQCGTYGLEKVPWGPYKGIWKHLPIQYQMFLYNMFKVGERYSVIEMIIMTQTYYNFLYKYKSYYYFVNDITFETEDIDDLD